MLHHPLSTIMAFADDSITYRVLQEAWKMVANKDSEILNRALALLGVFNAAPNGGSGYLALIFWATLMFQFGRVMTQEDWKENAVPTILWSCGAFWALGNFKKVYVLIFAGGAALSNVFDTYVFGTVIPNPQSWTDQFVSKLQNVVQSGWSLLLSPLNGFFMLIEFVTLIILMIAIVRVAFTFVVGTFVSTVFFAPCLAVYPIPESRRATHLTFRVLVSLSLYPVMWKVILHLGVWVFDSLMANVFILGGLISCFKNLAIGYLLWQVPKWALAVTDGTFAQVATLGASEAAGQAASAMQQAGMFLFNTAMRLMAPHLKDLFSGATGGGSDPLMGEVVGGGSGLALPPSTTDGGVEPAGYLGAGSPQKLLPPPDANQLDSGSPVGNGPSGPDGLSGPTVDGEIVETPPALNGGQNQLSASTSLPPEESNTSGLDGGAPNPPSGGGSGTGQNSGLANPSAKFGFGQNQDDAVTDQNPLGLLPGQELLPPETSPGAGNFKSTSGNQSAFRGLGSTIREVPGGTSNAEALNAGPPDAIGPDSDQIASTPSFDAGDALPAIPQDSASLNPPATSDETDAKGKPVPKGAFTTLNPTATATPVPTSVSQAAFTGSNPGLPASAVSSIEAGENNENAVAGQLSAPLVNESVGSIPAGLASPQASANGAPAISAPAVTPPTTIGSELSFPTVALGQSGISGGGGVTPVPSSIAGGFQPSLTSPAITGAQGISGPAQPTTAQVASGISSPAVSPSFDTGTPGNSSAPVTSSPSVQGFSNPSAGITEISYAPSGISTGGYSPSGIGSIHPEAASTVFPTAPSVSAPPTVSPGYPTTPPTSAPTAPVPSVVPPVFPTVATVSVPPKTWPTPAPAFQPTPPPSFSGQVGPNSFSEGQFEIQPVSFTQPPPTPQFIQGWFAPPPDLD